MNIRVLLVAVLLAVVATACVPPTNLRDNTFLQDTSLITGDPCEAPCFRGIIPGETSWQDALTIIEDDSDFQDPQTEENAELGIIQAAWQQGDNQVCCQMQTNDGERVSLIFLRTAPTMLLGEVIEVHGEPTYLIGTETSAPDQAVVSLVYPEQLMVIYVFVAGPTEGELIDASEIIGTLYLAPSEMDLLLQTTNLHGWEGYQTFATIAESEYVVTPSVTLTPTPAS
jgi:hypothetical protein